MQHPGFFDRAGPFTFAEVAKACGAELAADAALAERACADIRTLDTAGPDHVTFLDNRKYLAELDKTSAGACFVSRANAQRVPPGTVALIAAEPYRAFARALTLFYPQSRFPRVCEAGHEEHAGPIHPTARLEEGVVVERGASIGREARIGRGTRVCAGAVIGYRVTIGRDGFIGPNACLTHAIVGDRVIVHGGAQIGQDGFGFAMGPKGHLKVPQVGRVIIQDDVEIGANSTIDRGALKDTIIGEGTKIDNLVQIGHNALIGRHCVIVSMVGISGSSEIGDFVVLAGQAGVVGHVKIGAGSQIGAKSGVTHDLAARGRYAGMPARPLKEYARELAAVKRLARGRRKDGEPGAEASAGPESGSEDA